MGHKNNQLGKADKLSGFQISLQPILEGEEPATLATNKFAIPSEGASLSGEVGELPRSYGQNSIFLVAQEPHRLFTYWDLDIGIHPGGPAFIRCYQAFSGKLELEFEVPFEIRNWYIPVSESGIAYYVEIGFYRNNEWNMLGQSTQTVTPKSQISDDKSFSFVTLPLDTAFSALLASLPPQVRNHPDLMKYLAAIQKNQGGAAKTATDLAAGNVEALQLLKSILGNHLLLDLLSASQDSASLSSAIYGRLSELLSSESSSEMLIRFQQLASESSLFSGIVHFESLSSETISSWTESLLSWTYAARHAAASEWLSSWGGLSPTGESSSGSNAASSWFSLFASSWEKAGVSLSSAGSTSSWQSPETVLAGMGLSSWTEAALSSWAQVALSSWSKSALTSWTTAETSSWSEANLSSWFGEAMSSWTAESLSSWTNELLSSWNTAETSSWESASKEREFFMHVNAELIFYGGTHPDAKVTVDGNPVALTKDGAFHYHFVFPDGAYTVPIVAVSPDGVETRKATLQFERKTTTQGDVKPTGQPPLSAPLGGQ